MRRLRAFSAVVGLLVVTGVLVPSGAWAGGGGHGTGLCRPYAEGTEVALLDNCIDAIALFAPESATLTVRNDGGMAHTYTAVDGGFDTGVLQPGGQAEIAVPGPGVHRVYCTLHSGGDGMNMDGLLIVGQAFELAGAGSTSVAEAPSAGGLSAPIGVGLGLVLLAGGVVAVRRRSSLGDREP